jgi:hypothetical protein
MRPLAYFIRKGGAMIMNQPEELRGGTIREFYHKVYL